MHYLSACISIKIKFSLEQIYHVLTKYNIDNFRHGILKNTYEDVMRLV